MIITLVDHCPLHMLAVTAAPSELVPFKGHCDLKKQASAVPKGNARAEVKG